MKLFLLVASILLMAFSGVHAKVNNTAVCVIKGTKIAPSIQGVMYLYQDESDVKLVGFLSGMDPGKTHGFHVHQYGDDSSPEGLKTGGHYNPRGYDHHLPVGYPNRHTGDMGNIYINSEWQELHLNLPNTIWTVNGSIDSVVGRGIILHLNKDDGTGESGNAGPRIAQGVIGIADLENNQAKASPLEEGTIGVSFLRDDNMNIKGVVNISPGNKEFKIDYHICGLEDGDHGFHIHQNGDISGAIFVSKIADRVGPHYNPTQKLHGYPTSAENHQGDAGNIVAKNNVASGSVRISTQTDLQSIIGRSFIVHAGKDQGPAEQPSGASGEKILAGVIGIAPSNMAWTC